MNQYLKFAAAIIPALPAIAWPADELAKTQHLLPLVVDGEGWQTRILATNVSASAGNCQLTLSATLDRDRFAAFGDFVLNGNTLNFNLAADGGLLIVLSEGAGALNLGYAKLECSEPVVAQSVLSLTAVGQTIAMTFLPSAQSGASFQFPTLDHASEVAILVINDTESEANCRLGITDAGGATLDSIDYPAAAESITLRFLAEEFDLPNGFSGGGARLDCDEVVNAASMQLSGGAFTALPPAVLDTETVTVAPPMPATNENIENPTLTVANNEPVTPEGGLRLVWQDEFDGTRLDPQSWFFETGDGSQYGIPGWGNSELQWYLPNSAQIENGNLVITARREARGGLQYTSARINTRDRFAFRYGRIEARMKLPAGQGMWPAFWLMPQEEYYGGWAASGEIDIMEAVNLGGSGGNAVTGTLHYGGAWPNNTSFGNRHIVATDATQQFHVYALEWDEREMRWYVDDTLYATQRDWYTTAAPFPAPFDRSFYIVLNVAVGGRFPGPPNAATVFPVSMEVDYVRVYSGEP